MRGGGIEKFFVNERLDLCSVSECGNLYDPPVLAVPYF
jgi:hypothetical protein